MSLPIVLASTSPRRHELLNQVAIAHHIFGVEIDETQLPDESPIHYIQRMVSQKAQATLDSNLFKTFFNTSISPSTHALIITVDTIGVLANGQVLQKPQNFDHACEMWRQMSGTTHQVWTAVQVSLIHLYNQSFKLLNSEQVTVKTEVEFIGLDQTMMTSYWQTGEPQDKAGGYAIQGQGGAWVKSINGSYSNVVGLPLVETLALLKHVS